MPFPIALSELVKAYDSTGIRPALSCWAAYYSDGIYDARKAASPLCALIAHRHGFDFAVEMTCDSGKNATNENQKIAKCLGLTLAQVNEFQSGWESPIGTPSVSQSFIAGAIARSRFAPSEFSIIDMIPCLAMRPSEAYRKRVARNFPRCPVPL